MKQDWEVGMVETAWRLDLSMEIYVENFSYSSEHLCLFYYF